MLITDQIASAVPSPLRGPNLSELGDRFPDMSEIYDHTLCEQVRQAAGECGIPLREGVYYQTAGPNYETPAEIQCYRQAGASAVGMSTGCEAIARQYGYDIDVLFTRFQTKLLFYLLFRGELCQD